MPRKTDKRFTPPKRLESGDTVALISPASPMERPNAVEEATERLRQMGFSVLVGPNAYKRSGFVAGSDRERLSDLVWAYRKKKVRAIWCVRGGYGTGRILSQLPISLVQENPKILIGCSDITALLSVAYRARVISFHGPMPNGLTIDGYPDYSFHSLFSTLRGEVDCVRSIAGAYPESEKIEAIRPGRATGRLFGGNLAILCSLLGTSYFPDLSNIILFLEEIGEAPYRVDRLLTHLKNAGLFDVVKGIALGTFRNCEYRPSTEIKEYRQTLRDVIEERLGMLKVPVVYGLPFGHIPLNSTIPNGALATLDSRKGELVFEEAVVK